MSYERPQALLKPIRRRFITLTFAIALLLELMPLPVGSTRWLPDFVAMLILYWALNQPRRIGIGMAFLLGLITDVATTGLFGQHALAYSITAYLVLLRQRQLVMFNLGQQALVILAMLEANQLIMVLARLATGAAFVGWSYFLPPLVGALLWPLLNKLLLLPYRHHSV
ncbi:rod shape-determining protein MreD [Vogesella sp. LIG4]|uniref:rod shape-determining protein MreD n=1 Tax=Vogesella sp. LIG4 TaxID=1192162 RepID=UPI00081FBE0C|nr:rod shape-determining protein MreD [Vogesella sp. LIG4]SCK10983.1 rod shape-determining protein MreD [Vogesella sp. LIG4]